MHWKPLEETVMVIIDHFPDEELRHTKVELLTFLVDRQAVEERGIPLTGTKYLKDTEKPYPPEVSETLRTLQQEGFIHQVKLTDAYGREYHDYTVGENVLFAPQTLAEDDIALIEAVIDRFGDMDTATLVRHVKSMQRVKQTTCHTHIFQ